MISLPLIKQVKAGGKTQAQLEREIAAKLEAVPVAVAFAVAQQLVRRIVPASHNTDAALDQFPSDCAIRRVIRTVDAAAPKSLTRQTSRRLQ